MVFNFLPIILDFRGQIINAMGCQLILSCIQCGTEPFFFAWAGARRKLIMALEKKVGL